MSPELLNGADASTQSDVWAFGVTLYEALVGERPFPEKLGAPVLMQAIHSREVGGLRSARRQPERIPRDLETICAGGSPAHPASRRSEVPGPHRKATSETRPPGSGGTLECRGRMPFTAVAVR